MPAQQLKQRYKLSNSLHNSPTLLRSGVCNVRCKLVAGVVDAVLCHGQRS
jgi:hypothetical protein